MVDAQLRGHPPPDVEGWVLRYVEHLQSEAEVEDLLCGDVTEESKSALKSSIKSFFDSVVRSGESPFPSYFPSYFPSHLTTFSASILFPHFRYPYISVFVAEKRSAW